MTKASAASRWASRELNSWPRNVQSLGMHVVLRRTSGFSGSANPRGQWLGSSGASSRFASESWNFCGAEWVGALVSMSVLAGGDETGQWRKEWPVRGVVRWD